MLNNDVTKRKHSTILLIGGVAISFLLGLGVGHELFSCQGGCTIGTRRYCPCPSNLSKVPEAIEQLKTIHEQLKQVPEQLREVLGKLEGQGSE